MVKPVMFAAWMCQARDEAAADRIGGLQKYDRGRATLLPKSRCRRRSFRHHDVWYQADQLFRAGSHLVDITGAPAEVDHDIAIL